MAALSAEQENYVRMSLLLGVSVRAVRTLFDREFAPSCLTKSIRKEYSKIRKLLDQKTISKAQWKILTGGQLKSTEFDVSLMICLLRNLTNIQGPRTGYDLLPQPSDQCEGADLARLKYHRNFMAHTTDDRIDSAYLNTAWDDICGAIERLGGPSLKSECEKWRYGPLDQSNIDFINEMKLSIMELTEARAEIEDLKDEMRELKKENDDKTETLRNRIDRLPSGPPRGYALAVLWSNINSTKNKYNYQTEDFVKTNTFVEIVNAINDHNCVIITGPPGCGKSMNASNAVADLKKLDSERYDNPLGLHFRDLFDKESFQSSYQVTNKEPFTQIHIYKNVLGRCSLDRRKLIFWKENIPHIKRMLRTNREKVVLTCRSDIYETHIKENLGIPAYHCSVCYSEEEINKIKQSYVGTSGNFSLPSDPSLLALIPALCSFSDCELFLNDISTNQSVAEYISTKMEIMKKDSIWEYRALLLLCMLNNNIDKRILAKTPHSQDEVLNKLFLESGERVPSIKEHLERSLSKLVGSYIKDADMKYTFKYDWLFDCVANFIGKENVELVIDCSDSAFMRDNVFLPTMLSSEDKNNSLSVKISLDMKEEYENRLLKDLKKGYLWNVMSSLRGRFLEFQMIFQWFKQCGNTIKDNSDQSTALNIASIFGCTDLVNALIELDKSQINEVDSQDKTALYYACLMGYTEIAEILVTKNLKIDPGDEESPHWTDMSALYIACANQHLKPVELLLRYMKIKNCKCEKSPLHIACENGNIDIVRLLISRNASVDNVHDSLSPLQIASFNGHLEIVKILLAKATSVNDDFPFNSPLCMAASNGHREIVEILIQNFATVNTVVIGALTPIFAACREGHADIVEVLLQSQALIDTKYGDMTLLDMACSELHENVIDVLLKHDGDIEKWKKNSSASSVLHLVCKATVKKDKKSIVQKLLKQNIDINEVDKERNTAIDYALKNSDLDIAEFLIQNGATVDPKNDDDRFPLLVAARDGQKAVVEFLLENDAQVNMKTIHGNTVLNYLCSTEYLWVQRPKDNPYSDSSDSGKECFIEIIKLLLKYKADVNICNNFGASPLTSACDIGKSYCIPILLDHDLSLLNRRDESGKTPLYIACLKYHKSVVSCILKYKANVNQQCSDGETALHAIILSRQKHEHNVNHESDNDQNELLRILLSKGADVNLTDKNNKSVLHLVCKSQDRESAVILLEKNPNLNIQTLEGFTPLHLSCQKQDSGMVTCLLKHLNNIDAGQNPENTDCDNTASNIKCDKALIINKSDNDGNTPLHVVCKHGDHSIAEILIRAGADINKVDTNKCTPLYLACQRSFEDVVELLLRSHPNVNLACCEGWTALHVSCYNEKEKLVRLLLQYGADKSIEDVKGLTAREIASQRGYTHINELLS